MDLKFNKTQSYENAVEAVKAAKVQAGSAFSDTNNAKLAIAGLESAKGDDLQDLISACESYESNLDVNAISALLKEQGVEKGTAEYEQAMQAGALTMMAASDASAVVKAIVNPRKVDGKRAPTLNHGVAALEGFSKDLFDKVPETVTVFNIATSIIAGFDEGLFRTSVEAIGTDGVSITVRQPEIINHGIRRLDGKAYESKAVALTTALVDDSLIKTERNKVVVVATADNKDVLVDEADYATETRTLDGVSYETRPIKFNQPKVDVISLSKVPGLHKSHTDETDELDPDVGFGTVAFKVEVGGASEVINFDTSNRVGSLYSPAREGKVDRHVVNYFDVVEFNTAKDYNIAKTLFGSTLDLINATNFGPDGGKGFTIKVEIVANGEVDLELNNMRQSVATVTVVSVVNNSTGEEVVDAAAKVTVTALGWFPRATYSNANLSMSGLQVQSNAGFEYVLPVANQSPVFTREAVHGPSGYGVSLQDLIQAVRAQRAASCVDTLLRFDDMMASSEAAGLQFPAGTIIQPRRFYAKIPLATFVSAADSTASNKEVYATILNAATTMVNKLIVGTRMAAVLASRGLTTKSLLVTISCGEHLSRIMESGDSRALGNGIDFRINGSPNMKLADKIFITMSIKDSDPKDVLNFGTCLVAPSLIWEGNLHRGNQTTNDTIVQARYAHHVLCPAIARIDVTDYADLHVVEGQRVTALRRTVA